MAERPKTETVLGCPGCAGREFTSRGIVGMQGTFPHEVLVTKRQCKNKTCKLTYEVWSLVSTMQPELHAG